jgi:hypothetical protein
MRNILEVTLTYQYQTSLKVITLKIIAKHLDSTTRQFVFQAVGFPIQSD